MQQPASSAKHVLVTGQPGVGKSTVISRVLARLQEGGLPRSSFQGFWTSETRGPGGARSGFDIITWEPDGESKRGPLARVGTAPRGVPTVGKYVVDVSSIERLALPVLQLVMQQHSTQQHGAHSSRGSSSSSRSGREHPVCLVVIDEVGKMELCCPSFMPAVWAALGAGPVVFGSVPVARYGRTIAEVERIKARADVEVQTVTKANRDDLVEQLTRLLRARLAATGVGLGG